VRKLSILLLVVLGLFVFVLAHGEEETGILIDAKCAVNMAHDEAKVAKHTVACSIGCKDGGFGIVSDGKFYKFDDYGNKQALLLLKASNKSKTGLKVRVGGHFEGDLIKVSEIETVD
jgi:hypothetical protein